MIHFRISSLATLALALLATTPAAAAGMFSGTQLLSSTQFATGTKFGGALVFGLSGLDYNPVANQFISERDNYLYGSGNNGNPVAFTLAPVFTPGKPGFGVQFTGVNTLGGANGISSLESIRYDPSGNGVWLSSEGPNTLYHIAADGSRTQINLPDSVAGRTPAGSSNYGLEGLSFTPGGSLWVSREDPMSGDGAGLIRLSNVGQDGALLRQYAYRLDDVAAVSRGGALIANPPGAGVGNNGVSEILAAADDKFLVMERGFDGIGANTEPQSVSHNYVRIYEADLASGTDVSAIRNLDGTKSFQPLSRCLVPASGGSGQR